MKCTIIPVIIGFTGMVMKSLRKNLGAIPGKHSIYSLQQTAVLETSDIIRKVLYSVINSSNRIAAILYSLGTLFVSGIYVQIPCIKGRVSLPVIVIANNKAVNPL
jgi:hypothetical protein